MSALVTSFLALQSSGFQPAKQMCLLSSPDINESSGLAESFQYPGNFYTHNDSGDTARFFRFDKEGEVNGEFRLKGVEAQDWEDMAYAKHGGRHYLYLGDIGDNGEKRKSIQIHRVDEPSNRAQSTELRNFITYDLTYPDKAHNCEALLVDSTSEMIFLVTKNAEGKSLVFMIKAPKKSGKYKLQKAGFINFSSTKAGGKLVTGGAFSRDGKKALLRTYTDIFEYSVTGKVTQWFNSTPKIWDAAKEMQGESVTYRADGSGVITSSEGLPCPISIFTKNK